MPDKESNTHEDLISKLTTSSAMLSLVMERNIVEQLSSLKWSTLHSCYYTDPIESKTREIDVVGKQMWQTARRHVKQLLIPTLILHLVIECKTAKGYHLLFAPDDENLVTEEMPIYEWVGDESHRMYIARRLEGIGLKTNQITKLLDDFGKIAYPDESMCIANLKIDPIKPPLRTSAFRETNIGNEKDLESSVLWKAGLALNSAITSFKNRDIETSIEWVTTSAELAKTRSEIKVIPETLEWFTDAVNRIDIYHPIVVIDSMLWSAATQRPKQIDWCRLEQRDRTGFRNWWFDVVQYDKIADYLTKLTKHYASHLVKAGAKLNLTAFNRSF